MQNKITILGAPSDLGASKIGARLGPDTLRLSGIKNLLETFGIISSFIKDVSLYMAQD